MDGKLLDAEQVLASGNAGGDGDGVVVCNRVNYSSV